MHTLNIIVTHTQNTVRGKKIKLPDIFTSIQILNIIVFSNKGTFTDQFMNFK